MRHVLAFLLLMTGLAAAMPGIAAERPAAVAVIEVAPRDGGVRIVARALALSPGTFDARITIMKNGRSGRTTTKQGGRATLAAGDAADIATVGLSLAAGDSLEVELVLSSDGAEVARNKLTVGDEAI